MHLAYGDKPKTIILDQTKLRSHLEACLLKQRFTLLLREGNKPVIALILFLPTLQMGKNSVPPHSFSPPYRWGKTVYPHTLSPHLTDGEKQCTPTLFSPTLQMGKNSVPPHSFPPPYRWRERVNYTLFPLQYGGNLKMYPTLFFPIVIRWGKRVYPLHSFSPS